MSAGRMTTSDFIATGQSNNPEKTGETAGNGSGPAVVRTALFSDKDCNEFRTRWDDIQIRFVDDPRKAAEDADSLVAETMQRLAQVFSEERKKLEDQWSKGENVSTEDLRLALQRYRSFFNRLLLM